MQFRDVIRARRRARPVADPALRPSTVNTAWWLYVAASVASLLLNGAALVLNTRAFGEEETLLKQHGSKAADAHTTIVVSIVLIALVTLVYSLLLVLFARWMRQGHPISRIVVTVLAAISLFSFIPIGIGSLTAVLAFFAIVFTYLPSVNDWFKTARRPAR